MKNLNWSKMRFICIFLAFSLVILGYFFQGCLDNNKRHAIVCLLFSSLLLYYIKNITFI